MQAVKNIWKSLQSEMYNSHRMIILVIIQRAVQHSGNELEQKENATNQHYRKMWTVLTFTNFNKIKKGMILYTL